MYVHNCVHIYIIIYIYAHLYTYVHIMCILDIIYILYVHIHIWWIAIILTQWFQHVVTSHFHSFLKELEQTVGHEINGSLVDILDLIGVHAHQSLHRNPCSMRSKQTLSDKTCKFSQPGLLLFIILTSAAGNSDPACHVCHVCRHGILCQLSPAKELPAAKVRWSRLFPPCLDTPEPNPNRTAMAESEAASRPSRVFLYSYKVVTLWCLLVYNLHSQVRCIISIIRHP